MAFVVVLDACVLVPHPLFDTLLRAADAGLYEPRWSAEISTRSNAPWLTSWAASLSAQRDASWRCSVRSRTL